jgi:hypothetical protein
MLLISDSTGHLAAGPRRSLPRAVWSAASAAEAGLEDRGVVAGLRRGRGEGRQAESSRLGNIHTMSSS